MPKFASVLIACTALLFIANLGFTPSAYADSAEPGCYMLKATRDKNGNVTKTKYELQENTACGGKKDIDPTKKCYLAQDDESDYQQVSCSNIDTQDVTGFKTSNAAAPIGKQCGSGQHATKTTIDFGCKGNSCLTGKLVKGFNCDADNSAILDFLFAAIRFLSNGVGLIIVGSLIVGGIQYSMSAGDPSKRNTSIKRLLTIGSALLIYIFAYAILNFLLPRGFFK